MGEAWILARRFAVGLVLCFLLVGFAAGCAGPVGETGEVTVTEGADAVEAKWLSTAPLSPAAPPSANFDLSHWKLTLPSGAEVQAAQLNGGYTLANTFYTDPKSGGMVFRCPNLAGTTANSSYSRTELREMLAPSGSASADANNWKPEEGGILRARLKVDRVSTTGDGGKVGRVVIGQIHGPDTEVIRLYYDKKPDEAKGRIYAGMDSISNRTTWSPDIVTNMGGAGIALGELFTYDIRLQGQRLRVVIQPKSGGTFTYTRTVDAGYLGRNVYFKAGVYNQNNTGSGSDYVKATFVRLEQSHP